MSRILILLGIASICAELASRYSGWSLHTCGLGWYLIGLAMGPGLAA